MYMGKLYIYITASLFSRALEMIVISGKSFPSVAETFRLVTCYDLPRSLVKLRMVSFVTTRGTIRSMIS